MVATIEPTMEPGSQDRNLPASERKLKKARDDGQVSRSEDLSHLAVLGVGAISLLVLAPVLYERLHESMRQLLTFNATSVKHTGSMLLRLSEATTIGLAGCVTFAAIVSAATISAAVKEAESVTAPAITNVISPRTSLFVAQADSSFKFPRIVSSY